MIDFIQLSSKQQLLFPNISAISYYVEKVLGLPLITYIV